MMTRRLAFLFLNLVSDTCKNSFVYMFGYVPPRRTKRSAELTSEVLLER